MALAWQGIKGYGIQVWVSRGIRDTGILYGIRDTGIRDTRDNGILGYAERGATRASGQRDTAPNILPLAKAAVARATETAAAARARSSLGQAANCVRQSVRYEECNIV